MEPPTEPLHPIPVHSPFHRIGIDLIGPLPVSITGQRYIIVATDYLTKWAITKAATDKSATTVAQFIYKRICLIYGTPHNVLTDQGLEFRNQTIRALCALFDIRHTYATPYRPQTNGLTERLNKTLGEALARSVALSDDKTIWPQFLPAVTFTYNTNRQATTGFSPAQLLLGYQPKGSESLMQPGSCDHSYLTSSELYSRGAQLHQRYDEQIPLAKERIQRKQQQQKERHDRKLKGRPPITIGQQVYLRRDELQNRFDTKLETRWTGPHLILDQPSPATFLIQVGNTERLVHRDRLKQAHPTSDLATR
jgi:transposase InsO family protein